MANDRDLDEIAKGIRAAMRLSYRKLRRLGYSRDIAKAELRRLTREAINQISE